MNDFPVLTTQRLILRQPVESDIDFIFEQRSSPVVNKFIKREPAKTREDAVVHFEKITRNFTENKAIAWSICLQQNHQIIGSICLWNFSEDLKTVELGYDLHPDFYNKGFMTEAIRPVVKYGFNKLNFETIEAFTNRNNEASKRILLKNNFIHDPKREDDGFPENWIYTLKK